MRIVYTLQIMDELMRKMRGREGINFFFFNLDFYIQCWRKEKAKTQKDRKKVLLVH
jgi:hypothetical protein